MAFLCKDEDEQASQSLPFPSFLFLAANWVGGGGLSSSSSFPALYISSTTAGPQFFSFPLARAKRELEREGREEGRRRKMTFPLLLLFLRPHFLFRRRRGRLIGGKRDNKTFVTSAFRGRPTMKKKPSFPALNSRGCVRGAKEWEKVLI